MNLPGIFSLNKHLTCIDRFSPDTLIAGAGALLSDDPAELLLLRTRVSKDGARLLDQVASVSIPLAAAAAASATGSNGGGGECLSVRTNSISSESSLLALRTQRVVSNARLPSSAVYKLVKTERASASAGPDAEEEDRAADLAGADVDDGPKIAAAEFSLEFVGEIPRADAMSAAGKPSQARDCRSLYWGPFGSGGGGDENDGIDGASVVVAVDSLCVRWFTVAEGVVAEQSAVPLVDAPTSSAEFQLVQAAASDPHRPSVVCVARGPALTAYDSRSSSKQPAWTVDRAHQSVVCCLDFNPNVVNLLCSGGDDGVVRFWDLRKSASGPCEHRQIAAYSRGFVHSVSFHGIHDELVLVGADDGVAVVNAVSLSSSSSKAAARTAARAPSSASSSRQPLSENTGAMLNQLVSSSVETRTAGFSDGNTSQQSKQALQALRQEQLAMNDGLVQVDFKFPSTRAVWLSDSSDPILYANLSPFSGDSSNRRVSVHDFGTTLKKSED